MFVYFMFINYKEIYIIGKMGRVVTLMAAKFKGYNLFFLVRDYYYTS